MRGLLVSLPIFAFALFSCGEKEGPAAVSGTGDGGAVSRENWIEETRIAAPEYDPDAGGWDTERVAARTGAQLKELANAMKGRGPYDWESIHAWLGDGLSSHPLTADGDTVYQRGALEVRRVEDPSKLPLLDKAAFLEQVKTARPSVTQFKIVAIEAGQEAEEWATEVVVHHTGRRNDRTEQWNARWHCEWRQSGEHLILLSSRVLELESVAMKSAGPAFADCTGSVFAGVKSFEGQLLPGVDRWLGLVDSRHGMDVGGWQGLAVGDANGDGLEDLYACQPGGLPNRLYLQHADGTLKDFSKASGTDWLESTHGAIFFDSDNDGDQDLLVGLPDGIASMKNNGKGVFSVHLHGNRSGGDALFARCGGLRRRRRRGRLRVLLQHPIP